MPCNSDRTSAPLALPLRLHVLCSCGTPTAGELLDGFGPELSAQFALHGTQTLPPPAHFETHNATPAQQEAFEDFYVFVRELLAAQDEPAAATAVRRLHARPALQPTPRARTAARRTLQQQAVAQAATAPPANARRTLQGFARDVWQRLTKGITFAEALRQGRARPDPQLRPFAYGGGCIGPADATMVGPVGYGCQRQQLNGSIEPAEWTQWAHKRQERYLHPLFPLKHMRKVSLVPDAHLVTSIMRKYGLSGPADSTGHPMMRVDWARMVTGHPGSYTADLLKLYPQATLQARPRCCRQAGLPGSA